MAGSGPPVGPPSAEPGAVRPAGAPPAVGAAAAARGPAGAAPFGRTSGGQRRQRPGARQSPGQKPGSEPGNDHPRADCEHHVGQRGAGSELGVVDQRVHQTDRQPGPRPAEQRSGQAVAPVEQQGEDHLRPHPLDQAVPDRGKAPLVPDQRGQHGGDRLGVDGRARPPDHQSPQHRREQPHPVDDGRGRRHHRVHQRLRPGVPGGEDQATGHPEHARDHDVDHPPAPGAGGGGSGRDAGGTDEQRGRQGQIGQRRPEQGCAVG